MRKFKFSKNFKPVCSDVGDEFHQNGIFKFNITKLLEFINLNKDKFKPEVVEVKIVRVFLSRNLDEKTIKKANLDFPIILAEISPGRFNVIDGNHRLEKAYRTGVTTISAYRLFAEQHIMFLASINAYKAYIEYWNTKVNNK
jgi:hypothetical protein